MNIFIDCYLPLLWKAKISFIIKYVIRFRLTYRLVRGCYQALVKPESILHVKW